MNNQNKDERDVRERIVSLMESLGQAPSKQITDEERQKLKDAAGRLDQMLQAAADADLQALKIAAGRLDQLLSDIRTGKDVTTHLKLRGNGQKTQDITTSLSHPK